jgi:hypothetical protein
LQLQETKLSISRVLGDPGPLSAREALTRFFGVAILVAIGYVHLMDISHKIEEGVWYMAFAFVSLIVLCVVCCLALVRADDSAVRFVWVAAAGLAAGVMFGYCVSRAIALPGMGDHRGDWVNTIGIAAWLLEIGLIGLSGFALRDRVLRRQTQRRPRRHGARLAAPAIGLVAMLAMQPAVAGAHGGEEMSAEEMAAADRAAVEMGHDPTSMNHEAMAHDPLLGDTELGVILVAAVGFVGWAGLTLRRRVTDPRGPSAARLSHSLSR